jgi:hypothetical protein
MGFNRRKMEDERRRVAEKEAASRRATRQIGSPDGPRRGRVPLPQTSGPRRGGPLRSGRLYQGRGSPKPIASRSSIGISSSVAYQRRCGRFSTSYVGGRRLVIGIFPSTARLVPLNRMTVVHLP